MACWTLLFVAFVLFHQWAFGSDADAPYDNYDDNDR